MEPIATLRDQLRLRDALVTRQGEQSLMAFLMVNWPILEPTRPFEPAPHLDLLCEYLEAVSRGEILRLVINMPPRYGKSQVTSVFWPLWAWVHAPELRWIFASHSEPLARMLSRHRRRVLRHPAFLARWGGRVRLVADQNQQLEFANEQRGVMTATSVGGAVTGTGADGLWSTTS